MRKIDKHLKRALQYLDKAEEETDKAFLIATATATGATAAVLEKVNRKIKEASQELRRRVG